MGPFSWAAAVRLVYSVPGWWRMGTIRYRWGTPCWYRGWRVARRYRRRVIPLPRAWLLTSAMLVGTAVGLLAAVVSMLLVTATVRPDVVIALVIGVPGVLGMLLILFSGRRWITALGAFILSIAPGWFGVLLIQAVLSA